jgi:alkylresorcinol/alkylpyrone synthase
MLTSPGVPAPRARLLSIATAVPPHILYQTEVMAEAGAMFAGKHADFSRLLPVFENTGIEKRHSARPLEWFREARNWPERTAAYLDGATDLFVTAAERALQRADLNADEIDTIVTVSSTGIATPSLEARAHSRLGFRPDVRRVPVFGLGCAGGATGLSLAARLAAAAPDETVLMVAVELCTLAFRDDELTKANIVATALFGDGGAAAVISARGSAGLAELEWSGEHLWPETLGIMGWRVDPVGFSAIFSRSIPDVVTVELRPAAERFLARHGLSAETIESYVFHPGGAKVVDALEGAFDLPQGTLNKEREVLRNYGNMSAPSVLFVLEAALEAGETGHGFLSALGPGFTASFLTFQA